MKASRVRFAGACALLVPAAALDVACVARLFGAHGAASDALVVAAAHVVAAALGGVGLALAVSPGERAEVVGLAAAGFAVAFFVPALGAPGLALALLVAGAVDGGGAEIPLQRLRVDLEGREWRPRGRQEANAPALAAALADAGPENAKRRFAAVVRAMRLPRRAAVQLLRSALRDPVEEVRLFAFSRLEQMRDALDRALEEFHAALGHAEDDGAREQIHLRLAETYWELAYLGLAEGSVLDHALAMALEHASASDSLGKGGASASYLRGRILLHRRDAEAAVAAFERASRLGYPRRKILPYLAECSFRTRKFEQVREHLLRLEQASYGHAPLARIRELWR